MRIEAAPAGIVYYNANIFQGYTAFITLDFFSSKTEIDTWISFEYLPNKTRYTRIQEVIYPIPFDKDKGVYFFDFERDKYPKRDKNGNWECGKCGTDQGWVKTRCNKCND